MIKKISLIIFVLVILSGCNLAISFFNSIYDDDTEPTPVPTGEPTSVPTDEPTPVPTGEPTPVSSGEPTPRRTPRPTGGPSDPTIQNGDFETGDTTGWDGDFVVIESAAHSGLYGARISSPECIFQNIKGLTPDTEYILSLYTRFGSTPAEGYVIIRYCENTETEVSTFDENTEWNYVTIPFTPCSNSTEATIYIYCDRSNINIDDIVLEKASESD